MAQSTASRASEELYRRVAFRISESFGEHEGVLRGVNALWPFGEVGDRAAAAILSLPGVRQFSLSVALFAEMARNDGLDPTALLREVLDDESIDVLESALPHVPFTPRHLSLAQPDAARDA